MPKEQWDIRQNGFTPTAIASAEVVLKTSAFDRIDIVNVSLKDLEFLRSAVLLHYGVKDEFGSMQETFIVFKRMIAEVNKALSRVKIYDKIKE